MKKSTLLSKLELIKANAEPKDIDGLTRLEVLDALLDYLNDKDIRDAVEAVPM